MATGKWTQRGIPHRGWQLQDVEDLGSPDATCEMCEVMPIRYVHTMYHPETHMTLHCGSDCALNMGIDKSVLDGKKTSLMLLAARRKRWPTLKSWYTNPKGSWIIKKEGVLVTVYLRYGSWQVVTRLLTDQYNSYGDYVGQDYSKPVFHDKAHDTVSEAKIYAFDCWRKRLASQEP